MIKFMEEAIVESRKAKTDIPVGAVIVKDNQIIARAYNMRELENDITSHAELNVIRKAEQVVNNWRLDDCDMYVTLEPCPMCGWAILQSRIKNLYFGSYDRKYGAFSSEVDLRIISNSKLNIYGGILEEKCDKLLENFFNKIRV